MVRLHPLRNNRFRAVAGECDDSLPVVLTAVEPSVRSPGHAVGAIAWLLPNCNFTRKVDLKDPVLPHV